MSLLKEILSSLDSSGPVTPSAPSPVARLSTASPKPVQRAPAPSNSASETPPLKRKASGSIDNAQPKLQKKEAPVKPAQANGTGRAAPVASSGGVKPASSSTTTVPYRGTAGLGAPKPAVASTTKPPMAKPTPSTGAQPKAPVPASKPPVSKPAPTTTGSTSSAPPKKVGGYMAMLQKAKEKDQTKAAAPTVKPEPVKIMSKKDRELARLQAKAAAKGKKVVPGLPAKGADSKAEGGKEKRKPSELGYQGTARPAKKPAEIGYKGTARPTSATSQVGRPGAAASKAKPKPNDHSRYNGYVDWSDVGDDDIDEEEEDYESDASSDMEGGIWDVEEEESKALKAAKAEDAAALAEEARLKREKEERKRKLLALSKANASKKRY